MEQSYIRKYDEAGELEAITVSGAGPDVAPVTSVLGPVPISSEKQYRVLCNIEYETNPEAAQLAAAGQPVHTIDRHFKRAKPGQVVDDLLEQDARNLVACGAIEPLS